MGLTYFHMNFGQNVELNNLNWLLWLIVIFNKIDKSLLFLHYHTKNYSKAFPSHSLSSVIQGL